MKNDKNINILAEKFVFGNDVHIMKNHLFYISLLFLSLAVNSSASSVPGKRSPPPGKYTAKETTVLKMARANISNGSVLLQTSSGRILSYNGSEMFVPASIWKLATAATVLFNLGEDYRFRTEFYEDEARNLYIKGYGDPFLVSEEIDLIAKELHKKLILPINNIYIDQSAFALKPDAEIWQAESTNPYDAGNYALAVNFNTIHVSTTKRGFTTSAEPQTPFLAIMERLSHHLTAGTHRINISQDRVNVNAYAAELFLVKIGGDSGHNNILRKSERPVPPGAKMAYCHYSSKKMSEIIAAMLLYSNNFIANQLFLTCGALRYGFPATWHKARVVEKDFLQEEIGLNEKEFRITEGSGLARSNRISGLAMLKILQYFKPYANLLPEKKHSLIKSGTMSGVYSYAGYLKARQGMEPFVIMLNQKRNTRERILDILQQR